MYEYFPNKEALVNAVVECHLDEAEEQLSTLAASLVGFELSLEELVRAMVCAMIELHAASPRPHRLLFEEVPHGPAVRRRIRDMEAAHARKLALLLPRYMSRTEPEIAARVVVELLEALTHRWIVDANSELLPRARMQDELERLVLAYLRAA